MPSAESTGFAARRPVIVPEIFRLLYLHNPFYLVSAGLILYAFHIAFRPGDGELINPWALMAALSGYTLLLALTAYVIVRFGKVWDDARSLVLVLILMFLAVSVSFDEIVITSPTQGYGLLSFGLVFSIAISEGLLRGLSLRLPRLFRAPYYAILALFFIFPLLVSPEITELPPAITDLRILFFPVAAGATFLGLIPAIRHGASYARNSISPWRWPWYPWAAFGFLALGVCLRSYGLSLSFSPELGMESIFGLYFLVPFLLALLVLALEIGLVEKIRPLRTAAACLAPGLLLLAIPADGGSVPYRDFLTTLVTTAGSPVYFTLIGLLVFYSYGWWRGMLSSEVGILSALLAACVIGRRTVDISTLTAVEWWPLTVLAAMQLWLGLSRRNSARCFAAALSAIAAAALAFRGTGFVANFGAIPLHLGLISVLVIGFWFSDRFAMILRRIGAIALPIFGLVAACLPASASVSTVGRVGYLVLLTALALGCWLRAGDRWYLVAGGINLAGLLLATLSSLQGAWNRTISSRGFQPLVWGLLCFILAAWISAKKGALWRGSSGKLAPHDPSAGRDPTDE